MTLLRMPLLFNIIYGALVLFSPDSLIGKNKQKTIEEKKNSKIVCLGDSVTEGFGVTKAEAFPALMPQEFAKLGYAVDVVNAGISGSTSASGVGRLKWIIKSKPSIVLIELGANDGLRGQDVNATKKNLKDMVQLAKREHIKPILIGMKLPPNFGKDYRGKFAKIFESVAKEENVPLIPFFDQFFEQKGLLQSDGAHPSIQGHKVIAQELAKFLVKYL